MNAHDSTPSKITLGVVGAGVMGGGIAQIAARAGIKTLVWDSRTDAAQLAKGSIETRLRRLVAKGSLDETTMHHTLSQIVPVALLGDFASCDVVVEAIAEDFAAKTKLFLELEAVVSDRCILATNTSSFSVTALARCIRSNERFAGWHFFNPVPLMKVAEVISGMMTTPATADLLFSLTEKMGHRAVRAKDTPGFIVNHAGRAYGTEALRILGENIADEETIDRVLREVVGFPMGPFELLDLTGLDVSHPVMESIYNQFYQEPRFRPSPITRDRLAAGLLGRKTGRGFYSYDPNGQRQRSAKDHSSDPSTEVKQKIALSKPIWIGTTPGDEKTFQWATNLVRELGGEVISKPTAEALLLVMPVGLDATTYAVEQGLDPRRTVALDGFFAEYTAQRQNQGRTKTPTSPPSPIPLTLMMNPQTSLEFRNFGRSFFNQHEKYKACVINDSPGFIAQRVCAMVVNVACDIAQQGIAKPCDIDTAVSLALGYPMGPLALGDSLGPSRLLAVLEQLCALYGDPRYRPSPWLRRRAKLGISLLNQEVNEC